jgi:hypothetical protein
MEQNKPKNIVKSFNAFFDLIIFQTLKKNGEKIRDYFWGFYVCGHHAHL